MMFNPDQIEMLTQMLHVELNARSDGELEAHVRAAGRCVDAGPKWTGPKFSKPKKTH